MITRLIEKRWRSTVFCCALLLGALVIAPHWLHTQDERYQGVPVHLNADEFSYLPRVQEVLTSGVDRFGVSIAGGEDLLPVLQPGLIEKVYGILFRPFVERASTIFTLMDFVMPFLLFLVMVGFCRACKLSRKQALAVAILFSLLELYNLGRPIHQRVSFLLVLLSLWGLSEGLERNKVWGIFGGALMGILIGIYFWSFTAVWAWWGIYLIYLCAKHDYSRVKKMLTFGGAGLITGIPFLLGVRQLSGHPLYEEVFFRSGVGLSRIPESWPWSILFLVMAVGIILTWKKDGRHSPYLVCTVATAFVLLNQHLIHGTLFLFASHYLFFLVFAAVMALVVSWKDRTHLGIAITLSSGVFLLGIAFDNRSVIAQWRIDDADFAEQHLASALPELDALERSAILSDPLTSSFIASHTKHDVLFTHYIQHELRTHQELAERYCLTQLPFSPINRHPEEEHVLIYGAAYDALFDASEKERTRRQELDLVGRVCTSMDRGPRALLGQYSVQYFFWDEKRQPDWLVPTLNIRIKEVAQGEGWSLWKIE